MALQLGALRTALLAAGISPEQAEAAAEEAAGQEGRLAGMEAKLAGIDGKLTAAMWAGGIMLAVLLASQAALWLRLGEISGQLAQLATRIH